jgi:DNA-binding CsgD family transcriptional regulator
VDPWIPKDESASVVTPLDFMSLHQWRSLPVYVDAFRDGPTTTHELIGSVPDGERRQLRLLLFRRSGRVFTDRERFDVQLLMPHLEGAYRRGQRQRVHARLTGRQASLMSLVRDGLTNHQIARRMDLSEGTVRIHLNNIYARLGVSSRTEAATRLFGHGGQFVGATRSDTNGSLPITATGGSRWESGSATHA